MHKQMQSLSDYIKFLFVNDMLRSFDLENENNHETLETQEYNPFDCFLQSFNLFHGLLKTPITSQLSMILGENGIH
jgi:hypothetical protein